MPDAALRHLNARNVNNDGIVRWPAFDLENALDRPGVQRTGGQPIHRFCRKRDYLSGAQEFRRALHGGPEQFGRVRRQHVGDDSLLLFHGGNLPATAPKAREKSRPVATLLLAASFAAEM